MRLDAYRDQQSSRSLLSSLHSVECLALYSHHFRIDISANLLAVLRNLPHLRRLSLSFFCLSPKDVDNLPSTLEYLLFWNYEISKRYSHPTVSILDIYGRPGNALAGLGAGDWPCLRQFRLIDESDWTHEVMAACKARGILGFHGNGDDWIPVDLA